MTLKKLRFFIPVVLLLCFWFTPDLTLAADPSRFVTCDGVDCSTCNFVDLINNILVWLFGIIFIIFTIIMIVAGFGLVTSGGNPSALQAAKSKFTNAIIGIFIVLAAWLIVDTVMRSVVGGGSTGVPIGEIVNWGPWSAVKCTTQAKAFPSAPGTGFPPVAVGNFNYQFYEQDNVRNCKIARGGNGVDQAACSTTEAAAKAAAAGSTYDVETCDPNAVLPNPPGWSTLPACGVSNTACAPLTPYSGTDPLGVEWGGTDPQLQACVIKFVGSLAPVTSAYRPQAYQNHLKEIHTKWCGQGLSVNTEPSCSTVKAAVGAEMTKHALSCSRPVATVSNHTSGKAIDVSSSVSPANAADNCLIWYGPGDPVHYTLKSSCSCK